MRVEPDLDRLAAALGISSRWTDAEGRPAEVAPDDLVAVLGALGYPAGTSADRAHSLARCDDEQCLPPRFLSGDAGHPIPLPAGLARREQAELILEDGESLALSIRGGSLPPIARTGYHRLHVGGHEMVLAIAPARCRLPHRGWGSSVQIPALRGSGAFGTLDDLAEAAHLFGERGAAFLAISPVHALIPGRTEHYSPYAPSSRRFLNSALAPLGLQETVNASALIDWSTALPAALDALERSYAGLTAPQRRDLHDWAAGEGEALYRHATFDALHLSPLLRARWSDDLRTAAEDPLRAFIAAHPDALGVHLLGQRLAAQALARAQASARASGMGIGLIADLAVGVDPRGSDVWANPSAYLQKLTIGAPPDPLGPTGQNWGLTTFSPRALADQAFEPWIAMIRAALRHCGGVRIDHAFGLQRLWVIPEGRPSSAGAYLACPFEDMLRIIALESQRHEAIIVAEDLGTIPAGFRERANDKGMLGMRVLPFERESDGRFLPPDAYDAQSVAMTGTHDTATLAGWWSGHDLEWTARLHEAFDLASAQALRARDRTLLWQAIGTGPLPPRTDSSRVVDAAVDHISRTRSVLAMVSLEDLIGAEDQVNIPGTTDEHPNWQRRLPAPLAQLLHRPDVTRRLHALDARSGRREGTGKGVDPPPNVT
ncbi:4-alpha-glucanotransferase [Sphingobium lignivorans]|uniref:4-alpha-glucanotransferase n=1 Tax=Sphingobium lignivorans TaxID=2735886 RepID=A0ABR6NCN2_9SPHN|nr:4-alpha-glucanotransferase [Sphingobium lignivorans]MBB5985037.1 4-alpha-glucanotransferase [Sphingobium lignivorans]